ncbi:uncharacterized protein [Typha angustifolia]|uniref:uncharacterized protein n=1 Tax=Typha angustifolia TaxID=59011 RepID=UPI003C2D203D
MSPVVKSKSKDRSAAREGKEQPRVSSKPSPASASSGNGVPASEYNPISGTFHTLEERPVSLLVTQNNGRFRTIDESEEHSVSSLGTTVEFDSASNNGSCSGESEDQKEKTSSAHRVESIPGCDTDKRDKIRQKNERKHQRQKEKRIQELHDRCSGYLMSRKLETLSQQLVSMGFSSEQATMALMQNEGRLEESISWLFEVVEESKQLVEENVHCGTNLKIDITDELAKMADMEVKYKCTKQEIERAVVACEGDLTKVEEVLKVQKQESATAPTKLEELSDPSCFNLSSLNNKSVMSAPNPSAGAQLKVASTETRQLRRDEREFYHATAQINRAVPQELANINLHSLRRMPPKPEGGRQQVAAPLEKRWLSANSTSLVSYSSSPSIAVPPMKSDAWSMMERNGVKTNALREPVIVMQRPQSINANQRVPSPSLSISASPPASAGWYSNGMSSQIKVPNGVLGHSLPNQGLYSSTNQQFAHQNHLRNFNSDPIELATSGWGGGLHAGTSPSPLVVPSSLGLFTRSGSASAPVDWSTGGLTPCDYTSIDWSLDTKLLMPSIKSDLLSDTWSTMFMGGKAVRHAMNAGDVNIAGLRNSNLAIDSSFSAGSHEWTSPFSEKDLFRASRNFVTHPPL